MLKPQTYMNLSGIPAKRFKDFFKVENDKILIIHDDIDVELRENKDKKDWRFWYSQWNEVGCTRAW